jgi:5,10-methylenetetrahydromethanopterin reductase
MTELPRISIRVDGAMHPRECVALAQAAEAAGLAGVWFAENAFARGILPAAAACAMATERLQINAGVFNPYSRHPAMMAMEIGALDELSNGRATLSIGSGIAAATAKLGLNAEKPLPALRDTLAIVRTLLQGGESDYAGPSYAAKKVRLDYRPRADIPMYLAARGSLAVKLSGEAADGLLVSNMCSVAFAGRFAEQMRAGRRMAGRDGRGLVVQYMPCAISTDAPAARAAAKRMIGEMLPRFWALGQKVGAAKEALLSGTEIGEAEFAEASARLRAGEDAAAVLDDRYAVAFSLAGTAEECLRRAAAYKAAGIDELALTFAGDDAAEAITALGAALARAQATAVVAMLPR